MKKASRFPFSGNPTVEDFNSYFISIRNESYNAVNHIVLLKQLGKESFLWKPEFWHSVIPRHFLSEVIQSDFKVYFYEYYFYKTENYNPEFDNLLWYCNNSNYIYYYKLFQAFRLDNFYNCITKKEITDDTNKKFFREIKIIKSYADYISSEQTKDLLLLEHISLEKILMGFCLFYESLKQQESSIIKNKSLQTQYEMALVNILNIIILKFVQNKKIPTHFSSTENISKEFERFKTPHKLLGKEYPLEIIDTEYKLIFNIIHRFFDRQSIIGSIDLFCSGYADFENSFLPPYKLVTNSCFEIFQINNYKSRYEEFLWKKNDYNEDFIEVLKALYSSRFEQESSIEYLRYNGISEFITVPQISLKKLLLLLKVFSVFKGPLQRDFIGDQVVTHNKGDQKFQDFFGANESISVFYYDELITNISEYFHYSKTDAKNILEFLSYDLNKTFDNPKQWYYKPFLKVGKQLLWLGSFLRDRKWQLIILNRFLDENARNAIRNQISDYFEKSIAEILTNAGFKTLQGQKYPSYDEKSRWPESGDIDVIALKNNELLIIEAKTSTLTDEFTHGAYLENIRLNGCASEQLSRAKRYVVSNWGGLKAKFGSSLDINDLCLSTLIVSNYCEGDLNVYHGGHYKTSILELKLICENKSKFIHQQFMIMEMGISQMDNLSTYFDKKSPLKEIDLRKGNSDLSVSLLIELIKENVIWSEIGRNWSFPPGKIVFPIID